eukprot:SAG25_NODE_2800_length_1380_cov_1.244340_1_plen_404_part_00
MKDWKLLAAVRSSAQFTVPSARRLPLSIDRSISSQQSRRPRARHPPPATRHRHRDTEGGLGNPGSGAPGCCVRRRNPGHSAHCDAADRAGAGARAGARTRGGPATGRSEAAGEFVGSVGAARGGRHRRGRRRRLRACRRVPERGGVLGRVVWMVGEYVDWLPNAAPDVLRQLTRSFVGEAPEVKLQTLTLAAKMCARGVARCGSISAYLFDLADCDLACDVRDRARALRALVGSAFAAEDIDGPVQQSLPLASRILVATAPRPAPILTPVPTTPAFTLGSLSYTVQHRVAGYLPLPEFATTRSDPTARTPDQSFANFSTEFAAKSVSASSAKDRVAPEVAASVHTSLDQFYTANASESSSDSEDDTSSSSGGYGSSGCSSNGSSSSLSSSYSSSSSAGAGYAV